MLQYQELWLKVRCRLDKRQFFLAYATWVQALLGICMMAIATGDLETYVNQLGPAQAEVSVYFM